EDALKKAPSVDPLTIHPGEFAYWTTHQKIERLSQQIILQKAITVTQRKEDHQYVYLTLVTELRELVAGEFKPSKNEQEFRILKEAKTTSHPLEIDNEWSPFTQYFQTTFSPLWLQKSARSQTSQPSYFNLKVRKLLYPTPTLVRQRPNCGGLSPCQDTIEAQEIRFDQVRWESRGGDKTSFQIIYSNQVPYLANRLKICIESKIDYQGNRIKIQQCEEVEDFNKGSQNSNLH
ncbi:MAG: hypothetical protein NZ480_03330, partial [Bdellovibrionaceae bacterium]|nr:hypothetical protein [Pseudobdellovibrionaceae bacterium]